MSTIKNEKMLGELLDGIINHDIEIVTGLIKQGVDVNGYEDDAQIRPLHFAVQYDFLIAAENLIAAGADPHAKTADGETPLDIARLYKNQAFIDFLEK